MAKPHIKLVNIPKDGNLTRQLNMPGLIAFGGDSYKLMVVSNDRKVPVCNECGGPAMNYGTFDRELIDITTVDGKKQFTRLHYYFYKYRCIEKNNPDCGIFRKDLDFVNENARTTRRYEDEIVKRLMFRSIDKVREDLLEYALPGHEDDIISKPAISKLIKRWVYERDSVRKFSTPSNVWIYTYVAFNHSYTTICEKKDGKLILLEVLPEISVSSIQQFFSEMDVDAIWEVTIDCNSVVYDAVKQIFPDRKIGVDTDALKYEVEKEYDDFVYEIAKNYPKVVRENLRSDGVNLDQADSSKIYQLRRKYPMLKSAYKQYSSLYAILDRHLEIYNAQEWSQDLSDKKENIFVYTLLYIKEYWSEIVNFYKRRHDVSGSTYEKIYELNQLIENYFPVCTDDTFRARMLYPRMDDLRATGSWKGIPVDDLLDILNEMITEGGLKEHERKRRKD